MAEYHKYHGLLLRPVRTGETFSGSIRNVRELKTALRHGEFAWPGGYQMYFITSDGAALSFEAAAKEFRRCAEEIREGAQFHQQFRIIGVEINYEDTELTCEHTGKPIPAAYAD